MGRGVGRCPQELRERAVRDGGRGPAVLPVAVGGDRRGGAEARYREGGDAARLGASGWWAVSGITSDQAAELARLWRESAEL